MFSAPVVALLVNYCWLVVADTKRAMPVALPQLAVVPLMVRLDVREGYPLRGSGEGAMAYGIDTTVSLLGGAFLVLFVAGAGRLSGWIGDQRLRCGGRSPTGA